MFKLNNLQIKRSIRLIAAAIIILASGLWVLSATAMSIYLFLVMTAMGCVSTGYFILKYALLMLPSSIVRCDASSDALYFTQKNGLKFKAIPMESSYMSPRLLLLIWQPEHALSHRKRLFTSAKLVILNSDNVSSLEDFRRLRVLLAFSKPKKA